MRTIHPINIIPISAFQDNYIWAIINEHRQALIIDPGDAAPVIQYLNNHSLELSAILVTHHHGDHTHGIKPLVHQYGSVPVYGPEKSTIDAINHPVTANTPVFINKDFPEYQVMQVPGHTLDHIAYYSPDTLFCGDTLFGGGCGRLFEGSAKQLYDSLESIAALPDQTQIYCAHEYTFNNLRFAAIVEPGNQVTQQRMTHVKSALAKGEASLPSLLKEEKATNPFLRCQQPEVIAQAEKYAGHPLGNPVAVFAALRAWKDQF